MSGLRWARGRPVDIEQAKASWSPGEAHRGVPLHHALLMHVSMQMRELDSFWISLSYTVKFKKRSQGIDNRCDTIVMCSVYADQRGLHVLPPSVKSRGAGQSLFRSILLTTNRSPYVLFFVLVLRRLIYREDVWS